MHSPLNLLTKSLWLLYIVFVPAFTSAQDQVAFTKMQRRQVAEQQGQNGAITLNKLLRDIETKHDVSFICKSELPGLKLEVNQDDFKGKQYMTATHITCLRPHG